MKNDGPLHLAQEYFDRQYDGDDDPWQFDTSWYERRKYAVTLASLPEKRYVRALEPGCANGALTELLAGRCDELIAFDLLPGPVDRARRRLADREHVRVEQESFPSWWPGGSGDLVVWSEVAYYLTPAGSREALRGLRAWLQPEGTVVAVHWTRRTNYPRHGAEIVPWLDAAPWLTRTVRHTDEEFDLGVWRRG